MSHAPTPTPPTGAPFGFQRTEGSGPVSPTLVADTKQTQTGQIDAVTQSILKQEPPAVKRDSVPLKERCWKILSDVRKTLGAGFAAVRRFFQHLFNPNREHGSPQVDPTDIEMEESTEDSIESEAESSVEEEERTEKEIEEKPKEEAAVLSIGPGAYTVVMPAAQPKAVLVEPFEIQLEIPENQLESTPEIAKTTAEESESEPDLFEFVQKLGGKIERLYKSVIYSYDQDDIVSCFATYQEIRQWMDALKDLKEMDVEPDLFADLQLRFIAISILLQAKSKEILKLQEQDKAFSVQAGKHFSAFNRSIQEKHQEALVLFLTQEGRVDPALLDKIMEDEELMQLLAADLFLEIEVPKKSDPPIGLYNQGSSCYRNASVQMVLHSPMAEKFKESLVKNTNLLAEDLDQLRDRLKISVAFKQLLHAYSKIAVKGKYDKELQKEMALCDRALMLGFLSSREHYMSDLTESSLKKQQDASVYLTGLLNVFGIQFELTESKWSPITGEKGEEKKKTTILPIALSSKTPSIQEMINKTFEVEKVDGDFRSYTKYEQQSRLGQLPQETLLMQIQRRSELEFDEQGKAIFKYDYAPIPIPKKEETIDLSQAFGRPEKSELYEVTGFTAYQPCDGGEGTFGHYISFLRKEDKWFKCDDSVIQEASKKELNKAQEQICLISLSKIRTP